MTEPRPFHSENDLDKMRTLLQMGRQANNSSYYVHAGDLTWWLFYPPLSGDFWQHIFLWEDAAGELMGWALLSPEGWTFDVYVQPVLRGTPQALQMYAWAAEKVTAIAHAAGRSQVSMMWVAQDDQVLKSWLQGLGFQPAPWYVYLTRSLEEVLPEPALPDGYVVRSCAGEAEVRERAAAQYGSFGSSAPMEQYVQRFARFMRSPAYNHELDVVAAATDGKIGAFCIVWLDEVNKVGLFEPVGTHPSFQRKGLGAAVLTEGLLRLKARGMRQAMVCTSEDNLPALRLYEKVGFRINYKLMSYQMTT